MSDPNEHVAPGWPNPRPVRAIGTAPSIRAILAAIAIALCLGFLMAIGGFVIRYLLEPNEHGGGFGALKDLAWALIYWAASGLAIGLTVGVLLASRVVRWVDKRR